MDAYLAIAIFVKCVPILLNQQIVVNANATQAFGKLESVDVSVAVAQLFKSLVKLGQLPQFPLDDSYGIQYKKYRSPVPASCSLFDALRSDDAHDRATEAVRFRSSNFSSAGMWESPEGS